MAKHIYRNRGGHTSTITTKRYAHIDLLRLEGGKKYCLFKTSVNKGLEGWFEGSNPPVPTNLNFLNLAFHTIAKIEAGATSNPTIDTVLKNADALGISFDILMK